MTAHIYTYKKKPIKFNDYEREQIMFYCNKYDMDYRSISHFYFITGNFERMVELVDFVNEKTLDLKYKETNQNN